MPVNVTVTGITSAQLGRSTAEWVKAFTIETAEKALIEEVGKGFDNQPVVITDGMPRRDYTMVKPYGKIEFAARPNMAEAVQWALTQLQKKSPIKTGRYASSHAILLNGVELTGNIWAALRAVKETDKVQIVNPQPYARKIEGATASKKAGRAKRRALSKQARSGVYRVVQRELLNRYGRVMFFDFKYVQLNTGVKVWGYQGGGHKRGGKYVGGHNRTRVQRNQVFPALQFFIKPTGLPN